MRRAAKARRARQLRGPAYAGATKQAGGSTYSSAFAYLGRSFGIPPPYLWKAHAVFRQLRRTAEAIPTRRAYLRIIPLRNHVMVPQQHAIEGMRRSDELVAALGINDAIDHLVDGRVLDADDVLRTVHVRRLRSPILALLVPGRQRLRPGVHDEHVEVAIADTVLVLDRIDAADRHRNPNALQ